MSFSSTVAGGTGQGLVEAPAGPTTTIDANTVVDGTVSTSKDLRIEGRVSGSVLCDGVVYVAEGAEVDANVEASGIVVAGSLSGTIVCHGRLEIRSTGAVRGRVETGRLIVVEGAVYEGQLRMDASFEPADEATAPDEDPVPQETPPPGQATGSYSFLRSFTPAGGNPRPADDVLPAAPDEEEPE